jgi:hypothetical protein
MPMNVAGCAALAAILVAGAFAQTGEWQSLFDGRTLEGWRVEAKPADRGKDFWTVVDGAIQCDSLGRKDHDYVWLVSEREFGDFELRLKVRSFQE